MTVAMRSLIVAAPEDERALASGADAAALALDVAPDARLQAARLLAARLLATARDDKPILFVRVNALDSGETEHDLDAVMLHAPAAILLPRCAGGADVQRLAVKIAVREASFGLADGATAIVAMIETADALLTMASFRNASPRLAALGWDAQRLAADLGAEATRDATGAYAGALRLARELTLVAAASAGVAAIDTEAGLERGAFEAEARTARRDGFRAKFARDSTQAAILNAIFANVT